MDGTYIVLGALDDWLNPGLLGGVGGGAAAAAFAAYALKQARQTPPYADAETKSLEFELPRFVVWLMIASSAGFVAFASLGFLVAIGFLDPQRPPRGQWTVGVVAAMFGFAAIGSAVLAWDLHNWRVVVKSEGLYCTSVWKGGPVKNLVSA